MIKSIATRFSGRFASLALLLFLTSPATNAEELNLVIQPIYPPNRAAEVYRPLVDYLNRVTSHKITLITPRNFHRFWTDTRRRDDFHLVFDDPHLTDYRIQKFGYTPMVRSAEPASFTLLAGYNVQEETLDALVAHKIVTMPVPSLGFAMLTRWYANPLQQPIFESSATSWEDTVEIVFAGEADAAVVPSWMADRYPNLLPIIRSNDMPGPAISASPAVSDTARQEITDALLILHEDETAYEVLVELNISKFEAAGKAEYAGLGTMLKEFYGY